MEENQEDAVEEGSKVVVVAECPVCLQELEGRVLQCTQGHLLCERCGVREEVVLCPTCRSSLMGRATGVEHILAVLKRAR